MTVLREPAAAPAQGAERMDTPDAVCGAAIPGMLLGQSLWRMYTYRRRVALLRAGDGRGWTRKR